MTGPGPNGWSENQILAALPAAELAEVAGRLQPAELTPGRTLYRPREPIRHLYFPCRGLISILAVSSGADVEVASIGPEGVVGISALLGGASVLRTTSVQLGGFAARLDAQAFLALLGRCGTFRTLILGYAGSLWIQTTQLVACNAVHRVQERLCRWLLQSGDAMGEDQFSVTQAEIARALGSRRAAVNAAALALQERGLIRYMRGRVTIIDRASLERASCDCYALIRGERERLLKLSPLKTLR